MRFLLCFVLVFVLSFDLAFAQGSTVTTVTSPPSTDTTVNVGQLIAPWLQMLVAAVMSVILAMLGWIAKVFITKAGLEGNAAIMQMEEHARNALQSALTNAAGKVVMLLGDKLNGVTLDVKHPAVKAAVEGVNSAAFEAVKKFGLTDDDLARMVLNKIGVVTASNPAVAPSMPVSSA